MIAVVVSWVLIGMLFVGLTIRALYWLLDALEDMSIKFSALRDAKAAKKSHEMAAKREYDRYIEELEKRYGL